MRQVVEVADIVALELELGAAVLAQMLQDELDVLERVAEDEVVGRLEERLLPVELPLLVAGGQREDAEVHRAHVAGAHLRLGGQRRGQPLLHRHAEPAAGGDVHHGVGVLLDHRQELHEHVRVGRRLAGLRVAGVQVQDRGTRLPPRRSPGGQCRRACRAARPTWSAWWMPPVTAQVMTTLRLGLAMVSFSSRVTGAAVSRGWRRRGGEPGRRILDLEREAVRPRSRSAAGSPGLVSFSIWQ